MYSYKTRSARKVERQKEGCSEGNPAGRRKTKVGGEGIETSVGAKRGRRQRAREAREKEKEGEQAGRRGHSLLDSYM